MMDMYAEIIQPSSTTTITTTDSIQSIRMVDFIWASGGRKGPYDVANEIAVKVEFRVT